MCRPVKMSKPVLNMLGMLGISFATKRPLPAKARNVSTSDRISLSAFSRSELIDSVDLTFDNWTTWELSVAFVGHSTCWTAGAACKASDQSWAMEWISLEFHAVTLCVQQSSGQYSAYMLEESD